MLEQLFKGMVITLTIGPGLLAFYTTYEDFYELGLGVAYYLGKGAAFGQVGDCDEEVLEGDVKEVEGYLELEGSALLLDINDGIGGSGLLKGGAHEGDLLACYQVFALDGQLQRDFSVATNLGELIHFCLIDGGIVVGSIAQEEHAVGCGLVNYSDEPLYVVGFPLHEQITIKGGTKGQPVLHSLLLIDLGIDECIGDERAYAAAVVSTIFHVHVPLVQVSFGLARVVGGQHIPSPCSCTAVASRLKQPT